MHQSGFEPETFGFLDTKPQQLNLSMERKKEVSTVSLQVFQENFSKASSEANFILLMFLSVHL